MTPTIQNYTFKLKPFWLKLKLFWLMPSFEFRFVCPCSPCRRPRRVLEGCADAGGAGVGILNFLVLYLVKFGASNVLNFRVGFFYLVKFGVFGFCVLLSWVLVYFRLVKFGALRSGCLMLRVFMFGFDILNFHVVKSCCTGGASLRFSRPFSSTLCSRCAAGASRRLLCWRAGACFSCDA